MRAKIWPRGPSQEQVPQRVPVAEVNEGNLSSARRWLIRLVKADSLDLLKLVTGIAWQAPYYCEASSGTGTRGTYCVCAACLPPYPVLTGSLVGYAGTPTVVHFLENRPVSKVEPICPRGPQDGGV